MSYVKIGVAGPVGSGKTALIEALSRKMAKDYSIGVITNDIYTKEDAQFLAKNSVLPVERIIGVETGGCPHTAIREDASMNLEAVDEMMERFPDIELLFIESGGDNLSATFSPELVDATIFVIDVAEGDKIPRKGGPGITRSDLLVINKIDLTTPEALEALVERWHGILPEAEIVPVSARERFNIEGLFGKILEVLPEGPAFYPKDTLTDKTLRFFASEIIREKILRTYDKEIPYCCEIEIESYKEEPAIDRIAATIYVSRESQKGIVIGHKGEKLKRVGQLAREDLEKFLDKKVFLQLFVKVSDDWRNNERQLRRFGYELE